MSKRYDVAVIGAGVFGAWTAHFLRKAGLSVGLFDAYGPANSRSSSGDESRITRMAYGKDALYSRWALESLGNWNALAERSHQTLFHQCGVLTFSDERTKWVSASCESIQQIGGACELLTWQKAEARFPQTRFKENENAIYEPKSGVLMARRGVNLLVDELIRGGIDYRQEPIAPPEAADRIVTVSGDPIFADHYVFACGPWLPKLFPQLLTSYIRPMRAEVFYLGIPAGVRDFEPNRMPAWIYMGAENWDAYGVPNLESRGFKVAVDIIKNYIDPDSVDRQPSQKYVQQMRDFVQSHFPQLTNSPILESRVCQYENTPSHHYLIDRHPEWENVWLVGGGSGHGFKNGPSVGRHVADAITKHAPLEPMLKLH
jgi:sarcosine oxidase